MTMKTIKATDLNVWVLKRVFNGAEAVANAIQPTDRTHMRRCVQAGLVTVEGRTLRLTPAGIEAVRNSR